ncbi:MAG: hypothetical protein HFH90_14250 [Lachnospiraceae bacterium]|nr:hypothetical protein [Lachnospiraceae bacterium]
MEGRTLEGSVWKDGTKRTEGLKGCGGGSVWKDGTKRTEGLKGCGGGSVWKGSTV